MKSNTLLMFSNNLRLMFRLSNDKKQRKKNIIFYSVFAMLMLPFLGMICFLVYNLATQFGITFLQSFLASMMFSTEIIVMLFGVRSAISMLFFSKDNDFLLALPVSSLQMFMAKFLTIYVLHVGLALVIQLPIILSIGIGAKIANVGYYIVGLIGSFLTPFIPLFVASIIAIPVGYIVSYFKKNNLIGTIFVLLLFGGFFAGYYYLIFTIQKGDAINPDALQNAFAIMSYILYPNIFLANSMVGSGLSAFLNFLIFFAIILGLLILTVLLSSFLYKASIRRNLESGSSKNVKQKTNKIMGVMPALLKRDIKLALGDTASAINYLMGFIIPPIVIVVFGIMYSQMGQGVMATSLLIIAYMFGCGFNYFAIVAFSREGKQFDILKMLPISSEIVIKQKMLISFVYTLIESVLISVCMFVAKMNYMFVLMCFIIMILGGNAINIFSIASDTKNPNLVWNNYKEMFKSNMKGLSSMILLLPIVIVGTVCVVCFDIMLKAQFTNQVLYNFLVQLPVLVLVLIYNLIAIFYSYPRIKKYYDTLEI